jgi:hypothetical protein
VFERGSELSAAAARLVQCQLVQYRLVLGDCNELKTPDEKLVIFACLY